MLDRALDEDEKESKQSISKKLLGAEKVNIHLILAGCQTESGLIGIGHNNTLPWPKIKADLASFKEQTSYHPVIMGRKTWESLPKKHRPLTNRQNIVVSRSGLSLDEAIDSVRHWDKVFVIGGGEVYQQLLDANKVDFIHWTNICHQFVCDTFVNVDFKKFKPTEDSGYLTEQHLSFTYQFKLFEKKVG